MSPSREDRLPTKHGLMSWADEIGGLTSKVGLRLDDSYSVCNSGQPVAHFSDLFNGSALPRKPEFNGFIHSRMSSILQSFGNCES